MRAIDRKLRLVLIGLFVYCSVDTPLLLASDPPETDTTPAPRTAANQSVGIEEPPKADLKADLPENEAAETANPAAKSDVQNETAVQLPPRGVRRLRAAERSAPTTTARPSPASLAGLWPLVAVTALIGVFYVLLRRYRGGALVSAPGAMRVLGRLNLSPRHQLALVQVGQRVLVVGVSAGDMRTLHVVDDADEAALLAAGSGGGRADAAFTELLGREGRQFADVADESTEQPRRGASSVSELLKKVRTMQTS